MILEQCPLAGKSQTNKPPNIAVCLPFDLLGRHFKLINNKHEEKQNRD